MEIAFDSKRCDRRAGPLANPLGAGMVGVLFLLPVACSSARHAGDAAEVRQGETEQQPYQCPTCKETVRWAQFPKQPNRKIIDHVCPKCNHPWYSFLTGENGCAECAQSHKLCPICAAHGGN